MDSAKKDRGDPAAAATYDRLKAFLSGGMRMSHVYQPVMLKRLLQNGGAATRREIAQDILNHDPTQIEYYETVVRDMVGRVLTKKTDMVGRDGQTYMLREAGVLTRNQVEELIELCERQIADFAARRGSAMWEHRRRGRRPISGTIRYEVLKRASFRCELCGVSADERALEVDHIVPLNRGGIDDLTNFQALCYPCNASKRDRDDTDFRDLKNIYRYRADNCIFCHETPAGEAASNVLAFVRMDRFPVVPGHMLIIPRRHVESYFDLTQPELNAIHSLLARQRHFLLGEDQAISGFNVGMNDGEVAGQTIMHCHIHLIPRRMGDVPEPRGGVRHTIPGKGTY